MIRFLFLLIAKHWKMVALVLLIMAAVSFSGWGIRWLLFRFLNPSWYRTLLLGIGWFIQNYWWFIPLIVLVLVIFFSLVPIRYNLDAKIDSIDGIIATFYVTYLFRFMRWVWNIKDGVTLHMRQIGVFMRVTSSAYDEYKPKKEKPKEEVKEKKPTDYAKLLELSTKYIMKDSSKHYKAVEGESPSGLEVLETLLQMKDDAIEKIESILTYPHLKTIINLVKRTFKKVGRAVRPQHIDVNGEFGFADPTTTAIYLEQYEIYTAMYGIRHLIQLDGDYDVATVIEDVKATQQGQLELLPAVLVAMGLRVRVNINMHGRLRIFSVIWPFIWLLTRRPIRREIRRGIRFLTNVYFGKDNKK